MGSLIGFWKFWKMSEKNDRCQKTHPVRKKKTSLRKPLDWEGTHALNRNWVLFLTCFWARSFEKKYFPPPLPLCRYLSHARRRGSYIQTYWEQQLWFLPPPPCDYLARARLQRYPSITSTTAVVLRNIINIFIAIMPLSLSCPTPRFIHPNVLRTTAVVSAHPPLCDYLACARLQRS